MCSVFFFLGGVTLYMSIHIRAYMNIYIHTYTNDTCTNMYNNIHIYAYINTHTHTHIYIYIYIYEYTHTFIHTHRQTYIHDTWYIRVHTYTYMYEHIYTFINTYILIYKHTEIQTYMYIHICKHIHTNICTLIHTYSHQQKHTYIHTHTHTNTHTYIHTYIHTCQKIIQTRIYMCVHKFVTIVVVAIIRWNNSATVQINESELFWLFFLLYLDHNLQKKNVPAKPLLTTTFFWYLNWSNIQFLLYGSSPYPKWLFPGLHKISYMKYNFSRNIATLHEEVSRTLVVLDPHYFTDL